MSVHKMRLLPGSLQGFCSFSDLVNLTAFPNEKYLKSPEGRTNVLGREYSGFLRLSLLEGKRWCCT